MSNKQKAIIQTIIHMVSPVLVFGLIFSLVILFPSQAKTTLAGIGCLLFFGFIIGGIIITFLNLYDKKLKNMDRMDELRNENGDYYDEKK